MKNSLYHQIKMPALLALATITCFFSACKKEEGPLSPTEIPEKVWIIPQGDHDYDKRIVEYFNRWGTYVLYKFTTKDINWKPNSYSANYKSVPADETYVGQQLDLLDNTFFKYYQDSTLRKYLPIKLFLCASLRVGTSTKEISSFLINPTALTIITGTDIGGYQSFAVNWGRKAILNINNPIDSTSIFRSEVNFSFLKQSDLNGLLTRSEEFASASDYITPIVVPDPQTSPATTLTMIRYRRGFIGPATSIPSLSSDWYYYLQAILSTSYANLTLNTVATDNTYKGILNGTKDPTGLIRKKYNMMIDFYKNRYNINLQAIGNGE